MVMKTLKSYRPLKNRKLHEKLIISYLFVVLMPIILVGYFLINTTMKTVLDQTNNINRNTILQAKNNINNELGTYLSMSDGIILERHLLDYLETEYPIDTDIISSYSDFESIIREYTNKYLMVNNQQIGVSVYSTNDTILYDSSFLKQVNNLVESEEWYKETLKASGGNCISKPYKNKDNSVVFSIGRVIPPQTYYKFTNVLKIEIPETQIYSMIEKEGQNKEIFLLDENNFVISCTNNYRKYIGSNFIDIPGMLPDILNNIEDANVKINDEKYFMFSEPLGGKNITRNWRIVTFISSEAILKNINEIVKKSVIICAVIFFITIIFVIVFSSQLTKRLKLLVRNMGKIRDGNFNVFVNFDEEDEIGELSRSFKKMIDRINSLISEVYLSEMHVKDMEIKKKEAEMNALQSQINPHFIFNTMESIRMSLLKSGNTETSDIIESFAGLLRKSIEWGKDRITLKKEIEFVENYLKIQKFRYRSKLEYDIRIDEYYYNILIPKFTLQPIVENAIYHGIEMKEGTGKTKIYTRVEGRDIKIIVEDDGVGMKPECLESVRESVIRNEPVETGKSIGLKNIEERLKLYFGPDYGIRIESTQNKGTIVEILIPITYVEKSESNV